MADRGSEGVEDTASLREGKNWKGVLSPILDEGRRLKRQLIIHESPSLWLTWLRRRVWIKKNRTRRLSLLILMKGTKFVPSSCLLDFPKTAQPVPIEPPDTYHFHYYPDYEARQAGLDFLCSACSEAESKSGFLASCLSLVAAAYSYCFSVGCCGASFPSCLC